MMALARSWFSRSLVFSAVAVVGTCLVVRSNAEFPANPPAQVVQDLRPDSPASAFPAPTPPLPMMVPQLTQQLPQMLQIKGPNSNVSPPQIGVFPSSQPPSMPQVAVPYPGAAPTPHVSPGSHGLPPGTWKRKSALGETTMIVNENSIKFQLQGSGELATLSVTAIGEFHVGSDGSIYGILHSIDPKFVGEGADLEGAMAFTNLSDVPFCCRTYSDQNTLAIKQMTLGAPLSLMMMTDGDIGELAMYGQLATTGVYERERVMVQQTAFTTPTGQVVPWMPTPSTPPASF